jgi:hypothetical protein
MTDAELEAERIAIRAEYGALVEAQGRLCLRPDDRAAHRAQRERLRVHAARVRAFQDAVCHQSVADAAPSCPFCRLPSRVRSGRDGFSPTRTSLRVQVRDASRRAVHAPVYNSDRVAGFLSAHAGRCYCSGCLSLETGVHPREQVNQIKRRLGTQRHGFTLGRALCVVCGQDRQCIAQHTLRAISATHQLQT